MTRIQVIKEIQKNNPGARIIFWAAQLGKDFERLTRQALEVGADHAINKGDAICKLEEIFS